MLRRGAGALVALLLVAACGSAAGGAHSPVAAVSPASTAAATASPSAGASMSPSAGPPASPSAGPSATPGPSPTPVATSSPTAANLRLVIDDYGLNQVRLARLDATDAATVTGLDDGAVNDQVIVLNGTTLSALSATGGVRKLGALAGQPEWSGAGTVAVKPDLGQWLYTIPDPSTWKSNIHLGSPGSDHVVASIPSPDGNSFYNPFAWNASGIYFVKEATGLGGAGPFLEYHFPLERFDLSSGTMTDVTPTCYAYRVLDEGSMICRGTYASPDIQVRTQSGLTLTMHVTLGTTGTDAAYWHVLVSPDNARLVLSRNGSTDPVINYQMAAAGLTDSTAAAFGPMDYVPDTWLPDGRLVADHECVLAQWGGGPCSTSLDGTYIFSSDGSSKTFFYKLKSGYVASYVT